MGYRLAADALLLLHFLWIAFLVLGLPLGLYLRLHRLRLLHALGLVLALGLQLTNILCPLTVWEEHLRIRQQPAFSYRGSFIMAYIEKLVYPGWVSPNTITSLTALLVGLTLLSFILKPLPPKTRPRSS
jgi:hypothetical protein